MAMMIVQTQRDTMFEIEIVLYTHNDHMRNTMEILRTNNWIIVMTKLNSFLVLAQTIGTTIHADIDDFQSNFGALRWAYKPADNETMEFTLFYIN